MKRPIADPWSRLDVSQKEKQGSECPWKTVERRAIQTMCRLHSETDLGGKMRGILPILMLAPFFMLAGCNRVSTPGIPPTPGDFVRNQSGVGTAQVFGIDFRVSVSSSGASTEDEIDANFVDVEQTIARKRFTFGEEIVIQLDSINESQVGFTFNDLDFGSLNVRDQVSIDSERNVMVNGTSRLPVGFR